jgi:phage FluMu protein Com
MDNFSKIRCLGCGIFLVAIIGAESLSIICDKCHHIFMPHLPEQNYAVGTASITGIAVSGISDTATATIFPWFDTNS